ncbi:MAG: NRDE family protein [Proteobacteria bacterium]|nr:NRDE family protein [Pseudomonadota bacterium]MBU4469654.1 NRDE family protein [Pseudomonadota bacterium]MCG2751737.1 NRDE family protein [Desulfobacteraceae bacterium]
MCLILLACDIHPEFRLVLAANRDEFYHRPAAPLSFWQDTPQVLAGRDLKAGGTWLGMSRTGKISAITNYRDPASILNDAPTRGALVTDYLAGDETAPSYLSRVQSKGHQYNGFNLLAGTSQDLYYYSNREGAFRRLASGIHGLSNHLLDTPWPKIQKGTKALEEILGRTGELDVEAVFDMLLDRTPVAEKDLPSTGVSMEMEKMLSPLFIVSEGYGTRCSSVVLMERSGRRTFYERTFEVLNQEPVDRGTVKIVIDNL